MYWILLINATTGRDVAIGRASNMRFAIMEGNYPLTTLNTPGRVIEKLMTQRRKL